MILPSNSASHRALDSSRTAALAEPVALDFKNTPAAPSRPCAFWETADCSRAANSDRSGFAFRKLEFAFDERTELSSSSSDWPSIPAKSTRSESKGATTWNVDALACRLERRDCAPLHSPSEALIDAKDCQGSDIQTSALDKSAAVILFCSFELVFTCSSHRIPGFSLCHLGLAIQEARLKDLEGVGPFGPLRLSLEPK